MHEDVQQWLTNLGFEHLVEVFEENAVDWALLPEINNEDLKDLGVSRLADRKKLLAAIRLIDQPDIGLPPEPEIRTGEVVSTPVSVNSRRNRVEAEYRLLTVMFCDLVGSTALSTRMDPEQLRAIIARFQQACAQVIEPHGGFVARYMGDGILVYFGYPRASENDAERAVSAALAVLDACANVVDEKVRIGIATGRVIVGDLLGDGPVQERTVVGEAPNLAARLQGIASPGAVVVSDTTRRLAGGGFEFADLGEHLLKGFSGSVAAWQVAGTRAIESRFESIHSAVLSPLVGRKTELMLLMDRWELACDAEGQAVFISGEAGIGKSRLIEALRSEILSLPHRLLRYQCSPHFVTSAFYPVISQIHRVCEFEPGDTDDQKLTKLESVVSMPATGNIGDAQIFAHLLSLPFEHRYGPLDLTPQQIKTRTHEALLNQVFLLAEVEPVLFLVEDTHWADPASQEFMELLIGRLGQSRVLLVVTHRPDWKPNLLGHNNISSLQLNRLGRAYCASIVRSVAGEFVRDEIVDRIVKRTDGIPLFIEELTKSLVEGGLDIADADIPATLQASLSARIDRLDQDAKETMQLGAVIGREIPLDLIEAAAKDKLGIIASGLKQLVKAEFLFESGTANQALYTFKHGLVQDSIYENMLSEVRQQLHERVAGTLVSDFAQTVEAAPELVAYHYTEAGCDELAISYWHRAGKRSAARSADAESVAQLNRAIDILERLPVTEATLQQKLSLHIDLTGPLIATSGYGSAETETNTLRALELAEQAGETDRIFPVLYGKFVYRLHTGQVDQAHQQAEEFLALANRTGQNETVIQGRRMVGFSHLIAGQPHLANQHLTQAASFTAPQSGGSMPSIYGQDIEAAAKVLAAWARMHGGFPDQAIQLFTQALARAQQVNHANTLGVVLFHGGNMFVSLRLEEKVRQTLAGLAELNKRHDLSLWRLAEAIVSPGLMSLTGEHASVIEAVEVVHKTYTEDMHMKMHSPYMLAQSANAYLGLNQQEDAINTATGALAESAETGVKIEDPELLRIVAVASLAKYGRGSETENAFRRALDTARDMHMKWYELRIATDYARYLGAGDKCAEATQLLKPLVDSITEGADMPDMLDAREALDGIG